MSTSDSWCSPPEVGDPLEQFFDGPVDVDPCSNARSIIRAVLALSSGGLVLPWRLPDERKARGTVYENPPYSKGGVWTDKALNEMSVGNVTELVRLVMFQPSTRWWVDQCSKPSRNPRILGLKRLAFLDPFAADAGKKRMGCRFEPALIYFGSRVARFDREFRSITRWSTWGRSGRP